ncbi:MAG: hypothetical protein C7B47_10835 [Sulfobacillus thermosulfidooxidans]|uniref:Uncharacterized protein n=1 Tax=Sulfobacillus thermosulfidooxidans TaxID=28034 RepID=A0A2T2WVW6_SULTH|nr:MAG: hypothetical protein C7B47_10835 [Sulfobacillus thermosulfidooxidans]
MPFNTGKISPIDNAHCDIKLKDSCYTKPNLIVETLGRIDAVPDLSVKFLKGIHSHFLFVKHP